MPEPRSGRGGGDAGVADDFIRLLQDDRPARSEIGMSVDSHVMAAAAELSRATGRTIDLDAYRCELRKEE